MSFSQYKRLQNEFRSVLTGKKLAYPGSLTRKEATGYGTVFFTREMLKAHQKELEKRLEDIMFKIHQQSKRYGQQSDNTIDYIRGANIAGFTKVADAMLSYGFV